MTNPQDLPTGIAFKQWQEKHKETARDISRLFFLPFQSHFSSGQNLWVDQLDPLDPCLCTDFGLVSVGLYQRGVWLGCRKFLMFNICTVKQQSVRFAVHKRHHSNMEQAMMHCRWTDLKISCPRTQGCSLCNNRRLLKF